MINTSVFNPVSACGSRSYYGYFTARFSSRYFVACREYAEMG